MWPITPKWKSKNPQKSLQGLKKLNSNIPAQKDLLDEISKNDEVFEIRQLAFKQLGKENSQEALSDIAKNSNNHDVRKTVVEKLTDESVLAITAKKDKDRDVCKVAIEKLTDQRILAGIAKNDDDIDCRFKATKKLTDLSQMIDCLIQIFKKK